MTRGATVLSHLSVEESFLHKGRCITREDRFGDNVLGGGPFAQFRFVNISIRPIQLSRWLHEEIIRAAILRISQQCLVLVVR